MKISEHWLREWVNPSLTAEQLSEKLTMSGLEVESIQPVAEAFSGVVVAEILKVEKHPEADKLHICEVNAGKKDSLTIVCGAANVKAGMKVPAALEGAVLAGGLKISRNKIRGIESNGMLCSAKELGLAEQSDGLFQLSQTAPIGKNVWEYLALDDEVIDVSITPNRGDCLSLMGLSKEIAAVCETMQHTPAIPSIKPSIKDSLPVTIKAASDCPRYVGRVIRNVKADVETPLWMQERLRRSGQRSINPVVDVMNYVMFELGQPMHAFDLQKISKEIVIRLAHPNEELKLLDGQLVKLDSKTLIIADEKNPLAIAGVMGGLDSSVTLLTQDIFLESAYFSPATVARAARHYLLNSESSYRFERGIDPALQVLAIERATQLLLEITGGAPGPVIEVKEDSKIPQDKIIILSKEKLEKILGLVIPEKEMTGLLQRLGFDCKKEHNGWQVTVPARRSDITLDVDLIEEIARLYGYERIPIHDSIGKLQLNPRPENQVSQLTLKNVLCDLGYTEIISYSFVGKKIQALFNPEVKPKELMNPITADMEVMRTNLWPGLVNTLLYNQNRQQTRARLFEVGLRFIEKDGQLSQEKVLSGLISGSVLPEQWGQPSKEVDFFDLKGDLQYLLNLTHNEKEFVFKKGEHPALHPGQTAFIYHNKVLVGMMGALHPSLIQTLDISGRVLVFELLTQYLQTAAVPHSTEISKFPEIRRDIAILIDDTVPAQDIQATIIDVAGELLKNVNLFDLYQGKGIAPQRKSIALALTLQHASRTLVDEEVAELIERVIVALKEKFAAELRG